MNEISEGASRKPNLLNYNDRLDLAEEQELSRVARKIGRDKMKKRPKPNVAVNLGVNLGLAAGIMAGAWHAGVDQMISPPQVQACSK